MKQRSLVDLGFPGIFHSSAFPRPTSRGYWCPTQHAPPLCQTMCQIIRVGEVEKRIGMRSAAPLRHEWRQLIKVICHLGVRPRSRRSWAIRTGAERSAGITRFDLLEVFDRMLSGNGGGPDGGQALAYGGSNPSPSAFISPVEATLPSLDCC